MGIPGSEDRQWWWCLTHARAEDEPDRPGAERLGPYPDRDAAEHALATAAERTEAWEKDPRWNDDRWDDEEKN